MRSKASGGSGGLFNRLFGFKINDLPIRYKLIVHFLLIGILPAIGLGALTSLTAGKIIERQVTDNTLQLISKVNTTLEFYLSNMQNITYLVSFNPEVQSFLENNDDAQNMYNMRKFLQEFTTLHSEISGILVMNSAGAYISNELYARSTASLIEETWYQEAVKSKGLFKILGHPAGRNITSHVNYKDNEVISVVRAILDPDTQQLKGVVLIDLKLRVIAETAKDVRLGKLGYLMVLNSQGEEIYAPRHHLLNEIPIEWFQGSNGGTFSKKVDGENLQFIYQKSPFTEWTTVGVFSSQESVLEVREINFYVVSFVFILCSLGIFASFYLSYSISRPIVRLMSLMQKAESGDLNIRYLGDRKDEVGMLGKSLNTMLAQISKLLHLTEVQSRQKQEAEFRSLQAHIKPHFLYNTLDTIHWMARNKGVDDVAEVVESLSKLFRIGLSKGSDIIPLLDEIEHIKSYLKIQKTRYRDKLNYSIHLDPAVQGASVLKLLLQPLVENAIYHGIKERRGPGHILMEAYEQEGKLVLKVTDDGKGIPPEALTKLRKKLDELFTDGSELQETGDRSGYGLMNVQARIRLTFGPSYGLSVDSEPGQGTTVMVIHPILSGSMPLTTKEEVSRDNSGLESDHSG
ncbi:cache domain-containing sensor histidine kinase [Paenibacillus rigui]|uniref:histidine kinase n=1 Tax=Paenibacillus rigui TaxID=554312 RepID=A0A229UJG9_9BACL|nr:sensor histidine kinase [Paenibacillus rigui]OXM83540.1 histidine kinase [Paenibacillus rigui]